MALCGTPWERKQWKKEWGQIRTQARSYASDHFGESENRGYFACGLFPTAKMFNNETGQMETFVLMVEEQKRAKTEITFFGGKREFGENCPEDTAIRELTEETDELIQNTAALRALIFPKKRKKRKNTRFYHADGRYGLVKFEAPSEWKDLPRRFANRDWSPRSQNQNQGSPRTFPGTPSPRENPRCHNTTLKTTRILWIPLNYVLSRNLWTNSPFNFSGLVTTCAANSQFRRFAGASSGFSPKRSRQSSMSFDEPPDFGPPPSMKRRRSNDNSPIPMPPYQRQGETNWGNSYDASKWRRSPRNRARYPPATMRENRSNFGYR